MELKPEEQPTVPLLRVFVLTRDGIPVYAGREFDYITIALVKRLRNIGYPETVIANTQCVQENETPFMGCFVNSQLREQWRVFSVFAD